MTQPSFQFGDPSFDGALNERFDADVADVLRLSASLCAVPGITVPASDSDFDALLRTQRIAADYARAEGLRVHELLPGPGASYPFLVVGFSDHDLDDPDIDSVLALVGHLDVVPPREDDQFSPRLEGVDLYARGAADMKTVVATWLVWMARRQASSGPRPPVLLLLSSCEENGSAAPHHTGSVLDLLRDRHGVDVRLALVGERTGELEWMKPEPAVGPICKENRSWRWLRGSSPDARGLAALDRIGDAVAHGRTTIARLNRDHTPADRAAKQPGFRSGFVNPFATVSGDLSAEGRGAAIGVEAERRPGASIHSAAAGVSEPSLVERLRGIASSAVGAFGEGVELAGVEIGRDGNFNSYDGSGVMRLRIRGADRGAVQAWTATLDEPGIDLRVSSEMPATTASPTYAGVDIREVLDHRDGVAELLADLQQRLWGDTDFRMVSARPSWRCPSDHPDLVLLEAAYEAVIGSPSPDLVKLHGNDGGSLAERQQSESAEAARTGLGHAVVFGQVGMRPHGAGEFHRGTSVRPYWDILDRWLDSYGD